MSDALKLLLADLRQHPAFPEMLRAVEVPKRDHYRPSKGMSVEAFGAESIYASGAQQQNDRWVAFLTGSSSKLED